MNIFEKATRMAVRFTSTKGNLTVEDLWSLPLTARSGQLDLDTVAKEVNRQLKDVTEESFVATVSNPQKSGLELKLELVKHIIAVKLEEENARKESAAKAVRKNQILEILAKKQDAKMAEMSEADLLKELASL